MKMRVLRSVLLVAAVGVEAGDERLDKLMDIFSEFSAAMPILQELQQERSQRRRMQQLDGSPAGNQCLTNQVVQVTEDLANCNCAETQERLDALEAWAAEVQGVIDSGGIAPPTGPSGAVGGAEVCTARVNAIAEAWNGYGTAADAPWSWASEEAALLQGYIQDAGADTFDHGGMVTSSLCVAGGTALTLPAGSCPLGEGNCKRTGTPGGLYPFTNDCATTSTDCFGSGGDYEMMLHEEFFYLQTITEEEVAIGYEGACGECRTTPELTTLVYNGYTAYIRCQNGDDDGPISFFITDTPVTRTAIYQDNGCDDCHNEYIESVPAGTEVILVTFKYEHSSSFGCSTADHMGVLQAVVDNAGRTAGTPTAGPTGTPTAGPTPPISRFTGGTSTCSSRVDAIAAAWTGFTGASGWNYDANSAGYVADGGDDTYDGGHMISTSFCANPSGGTGITATCPLGDGNCVSGGSGGGLAPFTDSCSTTTTGCFGSGGSYEMRLYTDFFFMQTIAQEDVTIAFEGSCGECRVDDPMRTTVEYNGYTAYIRCQNGDDDGPISFFITSTPVTRTSIWNNNGCNDCHNEYLESVPAGTEVILIVFKYEHSTGLGCGDSSHLAVLQAVVDNAL